MNTRRAVLVTLPVLVAGGVGVGGWYGWKELVGTGINIRGTPSILSGKRIPGFRLPGLGGEGFQAVDIFNAGKPVVMHFWASWSQPCVTEHPVLLELKAAGVPIWGVATKDKRAAALQFLEREGDPYTRASIDEPGRVAVDYGVETIPETFFVDGDGYVRWHMTGPLTSAMITQQIVPLMRKFEA